jgi:ABC-2 type transport system ATP-binding protein
MPVPNPASVCVRDLSRRYGLVEAVRGISFDAYPGEIFGLLGPNGAGKSTTLECLLGLRRPDAGSITIGGIDALACPKEAKEICGAQIQGATLQDKITPRRALGLFASFYSRPAAVGELITAYGLSEKADAPFDSLSAGQRQRLFLALAFVNRPKIVVLDEPTAGLDPRSRRELYGVIRGMRDSGRTVILSTHDLGEAELLCDRVGILDEGRLVASAPTAQLLTAHGSSSSLQFRARARLGKPELAFLPGVTDCQGGGEVWTLSSASVNATLIGLVGLIEASGNELLDLRIVKPTLEDAFLSLTGRRWPPSREEAP